MTRVLGMTTACSTTPSRTGPKGTGEDFSTGSIVLEYGRHSPLSGLESEGISQIIWALREPSGHAARGFAEMEPPAPLDWLEVLEANDLFAGPLHQPVGCSLVGAVPTGALGGPLDPAAYALCTWLCKHLATPPLAPLGDQERGASPSWFCIADTTTPCRWKLRATAHGHTYHIDLPLRRHPNEGSQPFR
jgi:hypothetical protein